MTSDSTVVSLRQPDAVDDPLTAVLRDGARRLLAQAIEAEAETFLASMREARLPDGRDRLVRHGYGPERMMQTGIGPVAVRRVKLRDRGVGENGERVRFTSALLPRWSRRTRSLDALLPILYLRGVSAGDFQEALAVLLGKDAPNLSASVIARLKAEWEAEYGRWQRRDLSARRYVYIWADGVYLQARMEPQAECMLVVIGATPEGKKELLGFQVGVRESAQSWRELLIELKARGLAIAPELATGDGALGFWKALEEVFPTTRHQRCTVHKTANVLDKLPTSVQPAENGICARSGRRRIANRRRRRWRCSPRNRRQIRTGGRLPGEGPRRATDLLRLPGRALGPFADGEPDRERVRHGPPPDGAHQRRAVAGHGSAHGLQADHGGCEDLAAVEGRKSVAEGRCRCHLPQRRRGDRRAKTKRRLTRSRHPVSRIAPVENVWQFMRDNCPGLSNRIFHSQTSIVEHCCDAGTSSSLSPGASCQWAYATGRIGSDQREPSSASSAGQPAWREDEVA